MKIQSDLMVTLTDGDLEIKVGRALTTFAYKGKDTFVFRTAEIEPFVALLQSGKREIDAFYAKQKETPDTA